MSGTPSAPNVFAQTWADALGIVRELPGIAGRKWGWAVAVFLSALAVLAVFYPHDRAWLQAVQMFHGDAQKTAYGIAWQLGRWGDFLTYNVPVAVLIWLYGAATKSRAWRQVAIVCFLGASLAGLFDDCFRLTVGRPRPDISPYVPDGFYGPAKALFGKYQSFPSGHAASDVGMAVALLLVCRPLGIIASAFALAVIWGRMELNKHYPSDVLVGAIVGVYWGSVIGLAGAGVRGGSEDRVA